MSYTLEEYGKFVSGMLNPESQQRATESHILAHATMGLVTELIEYVETSTEERAIDELGDVYFYLRMLPVEFYNIGLPLIADERLKVEFECEMILKHKSASNATTVGLKLIDALKKYVFQGREAQLYIISVYFRTLKRWVESRPEFDKVVANNVLKLKLRHSGAAFNEVNERRRDAATAKPQ